MTPSSMLLLLHDPRRREEAARELLQLLRQLASRMRLEEPEDLVGDALVSLVRTRRPDVAARGDARVVSYLCSMLRNGSISRFRRRKPAAPESPEETAAGGDQDDPRDRAAAIEALRSVYLSVRAARLPRHRPSLDVAWEQQQDLLLGMRDMADLLAQDEGVTAATSEDDRKRARDRVLQNQHRLRVALEKGLQSMASSGMLAPDAADAARTALGWLGRCHRPQRSRVGGRGGGSP